MKRNHLPSGFRRAAFFLREYLFPFGCPICGRGLVDTLESWYGLCGDCRAGMDLDLGESLARKTCLRCGRPLVSESGSCLSCRRFRETPGGIAPAPDRVRVLFPYMGKYRNLLSAYKFGGNLALGNFLAEKVLDLLGRGAFPPDAVSPGASLVPVPPRPGRTRATGWDQVEYLARLLEGKRVGDSPQGLRVSRCLRRLPSKSQKGLGRENRMTNLRGRIVPLSRAPETALVIDDVRTTGSTLAACAAALREGGARTVFGLCLFYD